MLPQEGDWRQRHDNLATRAFAADLAAKGDAPAACNSERGTPAWGEIKAGGKWV